MKQKKLLLVIEELEERLIKDLNQKNNVYANVKKIKENREKSKADKLKEYPKEYKDFLEQYVTKDELDELERKFSEKLYALELDLHSMKARMISKKDLDIWENKIKTKFFIYSVFQITISIIFLALFWAF